MGKRTNDHVFQKGKRVSKAAATAHSMSQLHEVKPVKSTYRSKQRSAILAGLKAIRAPAETTT